MTLEELELQRAIQLSTQDQHDDDGTASALLCQGGGAATAGGVLNTEQAE